MDSFGEQNYIVLLWYLVHLLGQRVQRALHWLQDKDRESFKGDTFLSENTGSALVIEKSMKWNSEDFPEAFSK